jgi:replication initiator protein RepSA
MAVHNGGGRPRHRRTQPPHRPCGSTVESQGRPCAGKRAPRIAQCREGGISPRNLTSPRIYQVRTTRLCSRCGLNCATKSAQLTTSCAHWIAEIEDVAKPAHVAIFGRQVHSKGVFGDSEDAGRRIGYLTKYLTKSLGEVVVAGTDRQRAHHDRLHAELAVTPCSPCCAVWLLYGVQPLGVSSRTQPGHCKGHHCRVAWLAGARLAEVVGQVPHRPPRRPSGLRRPASFAASSLSGGRPSTRSASTCGCPWLTWMPLSPPAVSRRFGWGGGLMANKDGHRRSIVPTGSLPLNSARACGRRTGADGLMAH